MYLCDGIALLWNLGRCAGCMLFSEREPYCSIEKKLNVALSWLSACFRNLFDCPISINLGHDSRNLLNMQGQVHLLLNLAKNHRGIVFVYPLVFCNSLLAIPAHIPIKPIQNSRLNWITQWLPEMFQILGFSQSLETMSATIKYWLWYDIIGD